jgi:hypothetical protein
MPDQPDFIRRQLAFAAHLRDPSKIAGPEDVGDRRMAIYRDLVFKNVSSILSGSFPVVHRILRAWLMEDRRTRGVLLGTALELPT